MDQLREEIEKITRDYHLCPNRIWHVGSRLQQWETELCALLQDLVNTFPVSLKEAAEHEDHSSCTYDYCEFSSRNFVAVQQYHERGPLEGDLGEAEVRKRHGKSSICLPLRGLFREDALIEAVKRKGHTAWAFDGLKMLPHPRPFMAVSHVWSDGTGVGAWGPGKVNGCLFDYFKDIAQSFQCEGIWWDTVCIPQDSASRSDALNIMHLNYQYARITLVHDRFLRKLPFENPQTACSAIILSSWFSRGWTALELAKSQKVKVAFKDCIKDLDEDILSKVEDSVAAEMIRRLRKENISTIQGLLETLGPRHTSWLRDRATISGLLTGINIAPHDGDIFQRNIYQDILRKMGRISYGHLFHTSATMSSGFNWCPTNLFQMPQDSEDPKLSITKSGEVIGTWTVIPPEQIPQDACIWGISHPLTEARLHHALEQEGNRHVLLVNPADNDIRRGLLVRVLRQRPQDPTFKCKFVGLLRFQGSLEVKDHAKGAIINIGDTTHWQELDDDESAWKCVFQQQQHAVNKQDAQDGPAPDTNGYGLLQGVPWSIYHHAAWTGDMGAADRDPCAWDQPDELGQRPLHLAAERGYSSIVSMLLRMGLDPNQIDGLGQTPLHRAAWGGSLSVVELLLDSGSNPAAITTSGDSALHIAADMGYADIVRHLKQYADVPEEGSKSLTPLHYASMSGHKPVVQFLLESGADVHAVDETIGWTPMHCAAQNGHEEIVKLLIQHHADVNAADSRIGWIPLHLAAMNGHKAVVDLLVHSGSNVERSDANGWTPLTMATVKQHDSVVNGFQNRPVRASENGRAQTSWTHLHLVAVGAQRDTIRTIMHGEGDDAMTAKIPAGAELHEAAKTENIRASELLIEAGVPVDGVYRGRTALHVAASHGCEQMMWMLIDRGAKIESKALGDNRAIHFAAREGKERAVSMLIESGADINARNGEDASALHFACIHGHNSIVDVLLTKNASMDLRDNQSRTAMQYAVMQSHGSIVSKLLQRHGPIHPADREAYLALNHISRYGELEMAEKFLDAGADMNLFLDKFIAGNEMTAFIMAVFHGHEELTKLYLSRGADIHQTYKMQRFRDWAPLHFAAWKGHPGIARILLENGALIDPLNYAKQTPLHLAAGRENPALVQLLLEKGASATKRDEDGHMPHEIAAERGHDGNVEKLLAVLPRVDPSLNNRKQQTALHCVAGAVYTNEVMNFLAARPEKEEKDPRDHAEAMKRRARIVTMLMNHGFDPNQKDEYGNTPIDYAVRQGRAPVINALMGGQASVSTRSNIRHSQPRMSEDVGYEDASDKTHQKERGQGISRLFRRR